MKDKTLGIALWTMITLLAVGIVTVSAFALLGETQDGAVRTMKQTENY